MKKIYLFIFLMITSMVVVYSQCSTGLNPHPLLFSEINGTGDFEIRVYWNIVDDGNSPDLQEVQTAINITTAIYSGYGIDLVTDCNQEITTIEDSQLTSNQSGGGAIELCNFDQYSKDFGVNIFFMRDDVEVFGSVDGLSHIGGGKAAIKMIPGDKNWRTLVHELGHCFGLFHPSFGRPYTTTPEWNCETGQVAGDCLVAVNSTGRVLSLFDGLLCSGDTFSRFIEWEKVDGSNASVAGDFVVDTPAEMNVLTGGDLGSPCLDLFDDCSELDICEDILDDVQRKDQNCHTYQPDWNNFMGVRGGCQDHFTPGQVSRMKGLFNSILSNIVYEPILSFSQDITINSPMSALNISIKEGVSVTIQDTEVALEEAGFLFLESGSKLVLDNSTLTTCGNQWVGIICHEEAVSVEIKNNSIVEKAIIGVQLKSLPFEPNPQPIDPNLNHPTFIMMHSTVQDCDIGIQFGFGQSESTMDFGSTVKNNRIGIMYQNHSGLVINNGIFQNNEEGINSIDGYMNIRKLTQINSSNVGIRVEGTLPMASGIQIGDNEDILNWIGTANLAGIISNGSEHPAGVVVNNCVFNNNGEGTFAALGANDIQFANNNISNVEHGAFIFGSGSNFNTVNCNIFENIEQISSIFMFLNDRSNILENTFTGTQTVNIGHILSGIPTQGTATNPAANCFSDPSQSAHIVNTGFLSVPPIPFIYNYYDQGNAPESCQEPIDPDDFVAESSDFEPNNCDGNIGIFNLISTGGGSSVVGLNPQTDDPDVVCTDCIRDVIEDWIDIVVNAGGDDPTTVPNEENLPSDPTLPMNEAILNQWVNYALYVAMETNNIAFAEQVLIPMTTWYWNNRLYGLYALLCCFPSFTITFSIFYCDYD